ncbi:DUF4330 domain-containing protein [Synechococcus sp. M16CYN]|uniref:DUF4330 domain-containing protein n=1 Tax=Synechococcus sp. M16CYN TaxID=3103139 RepID=UPI0030E18C97
MARLVWLRGLSLVDTAAAAIAALALAGVAWSPKLVSTLAKATGTLEPVTVSVDIRQLQVADPETLLQSIRDEGSVKITIRNQPAGRVQLLNVLNLTPPLVAIQPDGRIVEAKDPNQSQRLYVRFLLKAEAESNASGIIFGGTKLKIGVPVDVEGRVFSFRGIVSGVTFP